MEGTIRYGSRTLYYRGAVGLLERPAIAAVGTRRPAAESRKAGYRMISRMCALTDMPVVTGLAAGCDTIAARAALDAGRPVIAVLPSSLDEIYPRSNRDLAEEIVRKGGCLISEYAQGEELRKWKFIARDRLMARIASAVIVIQCGKESGTMYTVRAAHRLGRPLACWMPEDTSAGDFGGNTLMAAEYGASPIRIVRDLREFLEKI